MIIDLTGFIQSERPYWTELEAMLNAIEKNPGRRSGLNEIRRLHFLYGRAAASLSRIVTFSSEPEIREYLENLVAKAYGEIHEVRGKAHRFNPVRWFFHDFPLTFRRHIRAFALSLAVMMAGAVFGIFAVTFDPEAKDALMPFPHLKMSPAERVAQEEKGGKNAAEDRRSTFSTYLMTHNTKVSLLILALGAAWGIGSMILLFTNGVMIGAVAADYLNAGQTKFLLGWLLPHGTIEIPAILIAGQAGLVLAGAILNRGNRFGLRTRLRKISGDLLSLIFSVAVLLIWAGVIESFFSQLHEPALSYGLKIGFGLIEFVLLVLLLSPRKRWSLRMKDQSKRNSCGGGMEIPSA